MMDENSLLDGLKQFLRTIQKPGKSIDALALNDSLVKSGLIDSLALVQIVMYLEQTYQIDFASIGFDPDRLSTMASIIELIKDARS